MHIDFRPSQRSSLGIEMELEIVDRSTRQLASRASELLASLTGSRDIDHPKAKHELMESTIEVNTGVCTTVAEARADLEATIAEVAARAEPLGLALMCSGTHPFSHWLDQTITPSPRYGRLVEQMQWPARQLQIFGVHCHVGVRSAEKAVAITGALTAYIPHLLALSASSPFWLGEDTGLASTRSKIFEHLPTAGLPYPLGNWGEFEALMTTLATAGAIETIREIWWDIRPHPNFGTVELRICDGMPTLTEVAAVGALSQCLVEWMDSLLDRGFELPHPRQWTVRENKWRAARYGLDARIIRDESGAQMPAREAIRDLVTELSPVGTRLGCLEELQSVLDILDHGSSSTRQRGVAAATRSLERVVDSLIAELANDKPTRLPGPIPS